MGCDIHIYPQVKTGGKWRTLFIDDLALSNRNYRVFGFLADVRNISQVPPICPPRGLPEDHCEDDEYKWYDGYSASWLSLEELLAFNYDAVVEDRRYTRVSQDGRHVDAGATCEPGQGELMTYREFLGEWFFKGLEELKAAGAERIVFWFDN